MDKMALNLLPPASVKGMLELDQKAFTSSFVVPALRIDAMHCNKLRKALSRVILKKPRIKDIVSDQSGNNKKLILLDSEIVANLIVDEQRAIEESQGEMVKHELTLTYSHYTADQILAAVLPKGMEITTSFETIGHIAHMNLKECHIPFRKLIGQVILDKNPSIKTVVNKTDSIEETFRFFKMELLAGEDNMNACVKQHGCRFEFDFSKVYWNSRLQTEHKRIVDILKPKDVICDVFAGVGPFAIPAAKKGCIVHANDLNPESYKALKHNMIINNVGQNVHSYNFDGREFLRIIFGLGAATSDRQSGGHKLFKVDHVIMNLPAISVEFLDVFQGRNCDKTVEGVTFHCYCFSKKSEPFKDATERVHQMLGSRVVDCTAHLVRNVAPNKVMMCVSFKLFNLQETIKPEIESPQEQGEDVKRGIKRKADH